MENEVIINFKNKLNSYYSITEESFNLLLDDAKIFDLKKNDILVDEGQISHNFYFLYLGYIIAYFNNSDGRTYNKNIFVANDLIASTVRSLPTKGWRNRAISM